MTLLERIAQQRTNDVVYTAISLTIEKIAAEVSREILRDGAFRQELKTIARQSLTRSFRDLRTHERAKPRARKKVTK